MAITRKAKGSPLSDPKLIAEGVSQSELPDNSYNYIVKEKFSEILSDIRVNKPELWAQINKTPNKTLADITSISGINMNDLNTIRDLCVKQPEYSHFLLPEVLRNRLMEGSGGCILTTGSDFYTNYSGAAFMISEESRLKTFEASEESLTLSDLNTIATAMSGVEVSGVAIYSGISSMQSHRIAPRPLVTTLDDLAYTSLAKDYIQNLGQKVAKGAEYTALLNSVDRPTNLGDSTMFLGESYPGHITIPGGIYNLSGTLQGDGEL